MKIILLATVPNLGKEGQVVNVKDGYARNFLFPRGLATVASKSQLQVLERKNARVAEKLAATRATADALKEKIDGITVKLEGKVGKDAGKLFGAITSQDIADAIKKTAGVDVDKRQVGLLDPIKRLGNYPLLVDLHRDVDAKITVIVFDPEAPVEAPAAEAAPAAEEEAAPAAEEELVEA